jgi:hypothetical protein
MPVVINRSILLKELKSFDLSSLKEQALKQAQEEINKIKQELLEDYNDHPVTKELEAGVDSENISQTLNGIGNLTTYIGFQDGTNPTEPVRDKLKTVSLNAKGKVSNSDSDLSFEFDVIAPSIEEIENVGLLPFEQGNSWIKGIENGISGFGSYIYGRMFKNSRSGKGIQARKTFRQGNFRPVRYVSEIMNVFYTKIKK